MNYLTFQMADLAFGVFIKVVLLQLDCYFLKKYFIQYIQSSAFIYLEKIHSILFVFIYNSAR